jgi:hypothetical protein
MPSVHWTTRLYALIPYPSQAAVLGIWATGGLVLPQASLSEQVNQSMADRIQADLGSVCRKPFHILRCLAFEINQQESRTDALYLLEVRKDDFLPGNLPEEWVWITLYDLNLEMVTEVLRSRLSDWLQARKAQAALCAAWQPSPFCSPWALPGWYAQAEAWIATEMAHLGKTVRAVEPLRTWCIS